MVEMEKDVTSPVIEVPKETKTPVIGSSGTNEDFWEKMKTILEDTFKPLSVASLSRAPDVIVPVPPELVEEKEIKKVKKQKNLWEWLF